MRAEQCTDHRTNSHDQKLARKFARSRGTTRSTIRESRR
jgi:hypothetical protein